MSHAVDPDDLAEAVDPYGSTPFLLYSSVDGSARVNHVSVAIETSPAVAKVRGFGRGVPARVEDSAPLSLLWPPHTPGGFSLIADGTGAIEGDELVISISAAVLHRPAPTRIDATSSRLHSLHRHRSVRGELLFIARVLTEQRIAKHGCPCRCPSQWRRAVGRGWDGS